MCGILGVVGAAPMPAPGEFDTALDLLAHRGPDDRGVYRDDKAMLGHRRLAILDLSQAGHQPMIDAASGAVIVFNGEIYNYLELRNELQRVGHVFRSDSDTEVLLRAWLQWGSDCLPRLNGMWAFAIWQPRQRKLFMARDRFGVKPFCYTLAQDGGLYFASEPKAILRLRQECREVDSRALAEFLAWGKLYSGERTFYQSIRLLRPAHCGEYSVDSGELNIWRYWDYPQPSGDDVPRDAEDRAFAELLDDAVRLRLRSDVPVGLTLSGGLDSTAILTSAMSSTRRTLPCYTAVYGADRAEAQWAKTAAAPFQIEPLEVEAPKGEWINLLQTICWHMDGPGYSPAVFPLWNIMKQARASGVPVLLEGQGADEALAGYPQYFSVAIRRQLALTVLRPGLTPVRELTALVRGSSRSFGAGRTLGWLMRDMVPGLLGPYRARVGAGSVLRPEFRLPLGQDGVSARAEKYADSVNARLWSDHSEDILPGLLHYGDAISMAHSVESRLPFMDYRLVEWLFSRGSGIKIANGQSKSVLRAYLVGKGQTAIARRNDKQGFPTPAEQWLAEDNGAILRETLLQPDSRVTEFCEPGGLRRLIDFHCKGKSGSGNHLYRLLATELWMRQCLK